jgi:uncharacterized protein (TIGR02145 family)
MKITLHIFLLCTLFMPLFPAAQSWSWETTFPNSTINDMKTLPSGTTYLVGDFKQVTPKDSASAADYFLIKVDSSGNIVGGFKKGEGHLSEGYHLGIDDTKKLFVFGTPFTPQTDNYYLMKYEDNGTLVWSKKFVIPKSKSNYAWLKKGAGAMDVNYGRIALTGNFNGAMILYQKNNASSYEKYIGKTCDWEIWMGLENACPRENEAYIVVLDLNGDLIWGNKFGSDFYYKEDDANENYYNTTIDFDDFGYDIVIDKYRHIIFSGLFTGIDVRFGNIKLHTNEDFIPVLVKFNPNGQVFWAKRAIGTFTYDVDVITKLAVDNERNIFHTGLTHKYGTNYSFDSINCEITKYTPDGNILWKQVVKDLKSTIPMPAFIGHLNAKDKLYVATILNNENDASEKKKTIFVFNEEGIIEYEIDNTKSFTPISLATDDDANIYLAGKSNVAKYVQFNPLSYRFSGNGLWSDTNNWEHSSAPPNPLRKWDTIFVRTAENDSCLLDLYQEISDEAYLIIEPGSRFIVPNDILTEPIRPEPTPITGNTFALPDIKAGDTLLFRVGVIPGKYPESTSIEVIADLKKIGGAAAQILNDIGEHGDENFNDLIYTYKYALPDTVSSGEKKIPFFARDAQMRLYSGEFAVTILPTPQPEIVISQIYTTGGVSGATYRNDFIELFNRGNQSVSLEGKSVQLASGNGTDLFSDNPPILLSGILAPGQYFLIKLAEGTNGAALPQSDATSSLELENAGGKLIIVDGTEGLPCNGSSTPCDSEQIEKILDLVGYGNANFFETKAVPSAVRPRLTVYLRNWEGVQDTQNNSVDFYNALPTPRNKNAKLNPAQARVVISQVYTAGGSSSKSYKNDFIELYNDGNKAESLYGWSVQYAEAGSSNWESTPLSGSLQPGQFLLISQAAAATGSNLPAADFQGGIDLNTTGGTILLVKTQDLQTGACPTGEQIIDKVGYGNATCFEGSGPTIATSTIRRQHSGGLDTDNNQNDLKTGPVYPRNRSFPKYSNHYRNGESVLVDTRDNKIYPIKRIGLKIWTLSNLNYNQSGSVIYDNKSSNADLYGRLYDWDDAKKAIPSDWFMPEISHWSDLQNFVGFGGELKDTLHWNTPNIGGNNASSFAARPGGYIMNYGFEDIGFIGTWWTNNQTSSLGVYNWAFSVSMSYNNSGISVSDWYNWKSNYYSVRCVRN